MATTETNRRKQHRIKAKLRSECKVDGKLFRASTVDLNPQGMAVVTGPRFPEVAQFELTCHLPSGMRTRFKVAVRYRRPFKSKDKSFLRLGLKVLASAKNAAAFFKALQDQLDVGAVKLPTRLPPPLSVDAFIKVHDRLYPLDGLIQHDNQLFLLTSLNTKQLPDPFPLTVSSGLSDEVQIQVTPKGAGKVRVADQGPSPVIAVAITDGEEDWRAFYARHRAKQVTDTAAVEPTSSAPADHDLLPAPRMDPAPDLSAFDDLDATLTDGGPAAQAGNPIDPSAQLDHLFDEVDPDAFGASSFELPTPAVGDPSANLDDLPDFDPPPSATQDAAASLFDDDSSALDATVAAPDPAMDDPFSVGPLDDLPGLDELPLATETPAEADAFNPLPSLDLAEPNDALTDKDPEHDLFANLNDAPPIPDVDLFGDVDNAIAAPGDAALNQSASQAAPNPAAFDDLPSLDESADPLGLDDLPNFGFDESADAYDPTSAQEAKDSQPVAKPVAEASAEDSDDYWDFGGDAKATPASQPAAKSSEPSPETSFWAAEIPVLTPPDEADTAEPERDPASSDHPKAPPSDHEREPEKTKDPHRSTNPGAPPADTFDEAKPKRAKDPRRSTNPGAPPADTFGERETSRNNQPPPTVPPRQRNARGTHPGKPPGDTIFGAEESNRASHAPPLKQNAVASPVSHAPDAVDDTIANTEKLSPLISQRKYKFLKNLGSGGFAEVYLVQDLTLDRPVAMKVLNAQFADDPELSQRFIAEAQIAAKFHHPNIVLVYEVGVIEVQHYDHSLDFPPKVLMEYPTRIAYFTMQYVEGRTLAAINQADERFSQMQVLDILSESAKALAFAHQKGVVHRDIKPENIMLTYENQVLVTDFGIAKVVLDSKQTATDADVLQNADAPVSNQTVGFLGTPNYVSPEQAEGQPVDGRSDIYSLGVTGYELLVGHPPFTAEKWVKVLSKHLYEEPKPLRELREDIHPNMAQLIHRCLEKKQAKRFQAVEDLLRELDSLRHFMQLDPLKIQAMEQVDDQAREQVKELFVRFARTFRTIGTYPSHHEIVRKSTKSLHDMFEAYFERFERLDVEVDSMAINFQKMTVLQEDQKESSLCFNLYRDGIRSLTFFRGFSLQEMTQFMNQLYHYVHDRQYQEKDSVTLLFQMGLQYLDFEYVDAFYEGHEHNTALQDLEQTMRRLPELNVAAMRENSLPLQKLMPFFQYMNQAKQKLKLDALHDQINHRFDAEARRETVRVLFHFIMQADDPDDLDIWVQKLRDMIQFSIRAKDLATPLAIFQRFAELPGTPGLNHPEAMRKRWLVFRKQFSVPKFLDMMCQLFENVNRDFRDAIKRICKLLDPQVGLDHVFQHFLVVEEEWRKRFYADMCVSLSAGAPQLLVKKAQQIDDKQTALLVRALRDDIDQLPQSALQLWLNQDGEQTRLALVKELASVDRTDTRRFVKQAALDTTNKFPLARQAAWIHLSKNDPETFSSVLKHFYNPDYLGVLGASEKKVLFQSLRQTPLPAEGVAFLMQLVRSDQTPWEERKRAAVTLKQSGDVDGLELLQKLAKKKMGNRDFAQFCRKIMGGT